MNSYEHTSRDFLPLSVIRSACAGDTDAVEQVLRHYRGLYQQALYRHSLRQARPAPCVHRRVHETPSGNQTYFLYCDQSRNGLTLSTFRDSTLKNMPAGQWRCIIGQTDTLLSVSSRTAGAPRCFSLKSGAITTTPQCKRSCLRAMTYRQADTPLPSKSERSERRRQ